MSESSIVINGNRADLIMKQDLVASAVNDLRTMMQDAITGGVKNIFIDMTGIKVVDSMGIGLLISTQNSLSKEDGQLEILNISADIMDLFKSMRLDQHFSIKGE
ncbi:MAG: STAS domain-containing protein [Spirochaetia bacterium]|jgi:anti-sigma B factor antagonist|nr:STAS domain-containing protein [Spirochaetia bacterium]